MNLGILGAGAWGTALAVALAQRHQVSLWTRDPAQAQLMRSERSNTRYLPGIPIAAGIEIHSDLRAILAHAELLLIVTPTAAFREVLRLLTEMGSSLPLIWACKGFESGSARLPHEIVAGEWASQSPSAVLSGPSFAMEVARGLPTALTLASADTEFARRIALELHQATLRVYYSDDVVGVEVGAAVKNVMAIATGICDGMELGMNARAALITRGLAEITRLGTRLGGRAETFMGLAGAGDLILTCTGDLSRNRRVGLRLAAGEKLDEILSSLGHVAEGVRSAGEVRRIAGQQGVEMPITNAVCDVLFGGITPQAAVKELLARDPKLEN